jgi:hypothetical protein
MCLKNKKKQVTVTGGGVFAKYLLNVSAKCVVNVLFMVHVSSKLTYLLKSIL